MQVIQVSGKPVVLTAPVRLVLEIDISQVTSDSAIPSGRKFLPFKGIVQLLLDFVFLFFEELRIIWPAWHVPLISTSRWAAQQY